MYAKYFPLLTTHINHEHLLPEISIIYDCSFHNCRTISHQMEQFRKKWNNFATISHCSFTKWLLWTNFTPYLTQFYTMRDSILHHTWPNFTSCLTQFYAAEFLMDPVFRIWTDLICTCNLNSNRWSLTSFKFFGPSAQKNKKRKKFKRG